MLEGVLFVSGGLLVGLYGYRLFHVGLGLYGFVLGAALGLLLVGPIGSLLWGAVVAVAGGLLGALLVTLVERAALLLAGGALGWVSGLALGGLAGLGGAAVLLGVLLAVVGAVAGLLAERLAITAGTALVGAWFSVSGAAALASGIRPDLHTLPSPELAVGVVAVVFAALQLALDQRVQRVRAQECR
jgi:hypothetical protein